MTPEELIASRVHDYYWRDNFNCATTMLKILAEQDELTLEPQILDAAVGLHGAGGFRAQCGLVEGALMFLGIWGRTHHLSDDAIINHCAAFANAFQTRFGSLRCRELRPDGFHPNQPEHLCEPLTREAVRFSQDYLASIR